MSGSAATLADLDWEECDCPLCGGTERRLAVRFEESSYHRCAGCGLVYLSPRVEEARMLRLYEDASYFAGDRHLGYETYEEDEAVYRRTFERRLREITPYKAGGRLLDVGCGTGIFLDVARRAGWSASGLDASPYAVSAISARAGGLGERIRIGTLESVDYEPGSFDVVTMFDFFEHVYRPIDFARRVARVLAPGGIAVVATPNYDSWLRRLLGRRTVSFKIPEHVAYYTPSTLASAVSECFDVVHVEAIGQYCTTDFVARRLSNVAPALGAVFRAGVRGLRASGWQPYVPSGSLLAILGRR
jgi:2-polyprenyl-3-methyl-5-hydroxy-6-metoxy-1,4-benzoquinol methylase